MEHGIRGFQTYTAKSVRHEGNGSKGKERNEAGDAKGELFYVVVMLRWWQEKINYRPCTLYTMTKGIKQERGGAEIDKC